MPVLVPYKNPDFVGRADILGEVKSRLGPSLRGSGTTFQTRLALFGLGGIGYVLLVDINCRPADCIQKNPDCAGLRALGPSGVR